MSYPRYRTLQTPEIQPSSRGREHVIEELNAVRSRVLRRRARGGSAAGAPAGRLRRRRAATLVSGESGVASLAAGSRATSPESSQRESSSRSSRRARGRALPGGAAFARGAEVPRVRSRADYDGGARPHAVARRARAALPASLLATARAVRASSAGGATRAAFGGGFGIPERRRGRATARRAAGIEQTRSAGRTSRAHDGVRSVRRGGRGRACRQARGAPGGGTRAASIRAGGGEGSESDDRPGCFYAEATNRQHGFVNATPLGRTFPDVPSR